MTNITDIDSYTFSANDEFFIDTSFIMYLYGPFSGKRENRRIYSRAWYRLLRAKCKNYVDVLIISEFTNRWARIEFAIQKRNNGIQKYKPYRDSSDFEPVASAIVSGVNQLLKHCNVVGSGFELVDIGNLLTDYEENKKDFNDLVFAEICRANGYSLITDDYDFGSSDIPILTNNQRLLA